MSGRERGKGAEQVDTGKPAAGKDTSGDLSRSVQEMQVADASGAQGQVWQRSDGGKYFEQPKSLADQRREAFQQQGWENIPADGGYRIQVNERTRMVRVQGPNGEDIGRPGRLDQTGHTQITIGDRKYVLNSRDQQNPYSLDLPTANGVERTYQNGMKDVYDKQGKLTERRSPDGSWEKYDAAGKAIESSVNVIDQNTGRVSGNIHVKYGANGKIDSYEKGSVQGDKMVVTEKGSHVDGKLKVERLEGGTMKAVANMGDRTDVALRADMKLDYLDKDGYGMPDQSGRRYKRDAQPIPIQLADGSQIAVNPIRSVKTPDGKQIDYEFNSDGNPKGNNALKAYTIRDAQGRITEYAHVSPDFSGKGNPIWFEYKQGPGQPPIPADKVASLGKLLENPDLKAVSEQLKSTTPLKEYMPNGDNQQYAKDHTTTGVYIDHLTGRQINTYFNGEARVRNERNEDFIAKTNVQTGETIEQLPDGRIRHRPWDSDPNKGSWDKTVTTRAMADGRQRVEMAHLRSGQQQMMEVKYGADGKTPSEVVYTQDGKAPIKMTPDAADPKVWVQSKWDGSKWVATDVKVPMKVQLADANTTVGAGQAAEKVPPGSIVITTNPDAPNARARVVTPDGLEFHKYTGPDGRPVKEVFAPPQRAQQGGPGGPVEQGANDDPRVPDWVKQGQNRPPGPHQSGGFKGGPPPGRFPPRVKR